MLCVLATEIFCSFPKSSRFKFKQIHLTQSSRSLNTPSSSVRRFHSLLDFHTHLPSFSANEFHPATPLNDAMFIQLSYAQLVRMTVEVKALQQTRAQDVGSSNNTHKSTGIRALRPHGAMQASCDYTFPPIARDRRWMSQAAATGTAKRHPALTGGPEQ